MSADFFARCCSGTKSQVRVNFNVTSIPVGAFAYCRELVEIELPCVGLREIGDRAFEGCFHLRNINLREGLRTIGVYAFEGCFFVDICRYSIHSHQSWRHGIPKLPWFERSAIMRRPSHYWQEGISKVYIPTSHESTLDGRNSVENVLSMNAFSCEMSPSRLHHDMSLINMCPELYPT